MAWYLSPVDVPAHVRLQIFFQPFSCQLIRFFFLSHAACGQSFHGQCFTMVGMFLEDLIGRFDGFSIQFGFVEPHQLPEEGGFLRRQALAAPFSTCFALRHGRVSTCTRATQPHNRTLQPTLSNPLDRSLGRCLSLPFFFFIPKKEVRCPFHPSFLVFFCRGSDIVSPGSAALCCVVCCLVEPNRVRRPRSHVDQAVSNTRGDSEPISKASGTTNEIRLERGYENQQQTEERLVRKET